MGYSVYVTGKPESGDATDADAKALSEALAPYLTGLEWAVESFSPDPEFSLHDGEWSVATKIGYDLDSMDVQLAQILALARVASRVRPDWTFEVSDDLDILEGDDDGGIVVQDGTFTSGAESAEGYVNSELEFADDGTFRAPDLGDFDIEMAERVLEPVLTRDPEHPIAALYMGLIAESSQDWTTAITWYRRASAASPDAVVAWVNLGRVLARSGQEEEASHALRHALTLCPDHGEARQELRALTDPC